MANNRIHLLELAQEKLGECIRLLKLGCEDDAYAKSYLIDHLRIYESDSHGFLSGDINIDKLIEKYRGGDDEGEDAPADVSDQETEELLERMGLN